MKTKDRQIGWHLFLVVVVFLLLMPIVFAISNSFKTMQEAFNTVFQVIPLHPTLENYRHVFDKLPFVKITLNTFLIASTVTMIPNYLLISKIGLRDRIWGVALPQLADVLGIFLLRQAMRGIPLALIEAARMENIRHMKIMRDIVIPLVRPSIISTGIIFFINSWNEYVWPVLILKSKENYTLSLALQMYISAEGGTEFTIAMAVSVLTMLIPLVLYIIFQRYIINTFAASGLKG